MTEEQKRQLDTIDIADILIYVSSKNFETSEALRYTRKELSISEEKLTKAKELLKDLLSELDDLSELSGMSYKSKLKEQVEQFLKEVSE